MSDISATKERCEPFYEAYGKSPKRELEIFFGLTFCITWGLASLQLLVPDFVAIIPEPPGAPKGDSWLYYLAVYGPNISALICLGLFGGKAAYVQVFKALLAPSSLPRWLLWLAISFSIMPIGWLLMSALGISWIGKADALILFVTVPLALLTTNYLLYDAGTLGEELGWRGYAMPRLFRVMNPVPAGLLLGSIWAIWHAPAFLVGDDYQGGVQFIPFFISLTTQGVVLAWIYLRTGGNWFLAGVVPHAVVNCSTQLMGFSGDRWMYALVPLFLAALVSFDPAMRGNSQSLTTD